jgi:sugar/nucleoside kinase (ribokinase family)
MSASIELLTIGTALVDSIIKGFDPKPVSASGYRAESGTLSVGGEAVNGAIAAAKLGVRTAILCSLGNDSAGTLVTAALEANGVDTGRIVRSDEHPTPVTTMFVRDDGSRQSITNTAHRYHFHPERFLGDLTGVRAVVLGSLFRAPFDDPEVISAVLKAVKSQGILIAADTKLPNFRFLSLADLKEVLPLIDYITPNEDEARYYTSKSDPQEMAEVFLSSGVKNVIIKLSAKGCYFQNAERSLRLPPLRVEAVDATGAGDTFLAGFLASLLNGASVQEALLFANACGAICTTKVGAAAALRDRAQVLHFLESHRE